MYECFSLNVHKCTMCMQCLRGPEDSTEPLGTEVISHCVGPGSKTDSLQKQQVFVITDTSLQPIFITYIFVQSHTLFLAFVIELLRKLAEYNLNFFNATYTLVKRMEFRIFV